MTPIRWPASVKLDAFIRSHMESILREWEEVARAMRPGAGMDAIVLRDHAEQMLRAIADDLVTFQSDEMRDRKSRGQPAASPRETAATIHGRMRFTSQFSICQLAAEFRALRASVLRLWAQQGPVDVDAMIRFNEAIDQALAESIEAFAAKSNNTRDLFLGVLGHDLRAPLATIGSAADVLLAQPPSPSGLQLGGSLKRATRHMAGMIENLINYTRLQLGSGLPTETAMVDLTALCNDAIVDARTLFPASEFELVVTGDARGAFDPITLRQLVTNLFINAAQHGDGNAPIRAELRATGECIVLSVSNRGPVVPESELASLFQPLVRHTHADTSSVGRTSLGLGLFIAHAAATAHGGDIVASSSPDGVTRFVVTLPVRAGRGRALEKTSMSTPVDVPRSKTDPSHAGRCGPSPRARGSRGT